MDDFFSSHFNPTHPSFFLAKYVAIFFGKVSTFVFLLFYLLINAPNGLCVKKKEKRSLKNYENLEY